MTREEFEGMAMKRGERISLELYRVIEGFYMSANDYHKANGGADEMKADFVKRVYGGKVNTPASILQKTITEAIKENRYALQGCDISDEEILYMDALIAEHMTTLVMSSKY